MHKLRDFKIPIDHLISGRQPNLVIVNNKKKRSCSFGRPQNKKNKEC